MKYKKLRKISLSEYKRKIFQIMRFCLGESVGVMAYIIILSSIAFQISNEFDIRRSIMNGIIICIILDTISYFNMKYQYRENQKRMDSLLTGKAILDMSEEELDELDELTKEAEMLEDVLYPLPFNNKI